jgi:hypothetical protein
VVAVAAGVTVQLTTLLAVLTCKATVSPTKALVVEAVTAVASAPVLDLEQETKIATVIAENKMILFIIVFLEVKNNGALPVYNYDAGKSSKGWVNFNLFSSTQPFNSFLYLLFTRKLCLSN